MAPAAAAEAQDADDADPVEVSKLKIEQRKEEKGKYGKKPVKAFKPEETKPGEEKKTDWIEIQLIDKDTGEPIPGEYYECKLADGSIASGTLDDKGFVRIEGVDPGTAEIKFPNLHDKAWDKKS